MPVHRAGWRMRWMGGVYMMVMLVWIASTRQGVCSPGTTRAGLCCVKWRPGRYVARACGPPGGAGAGGSMDRCVVSNQQVADIERASQQTAGRLLYVRVDMTCTDGVQRVCSENAACSCVWSAASSSRSTGCKAVVYVTPCNQGEFEAWVATCTRKGYQ